MIRIKVLIPNAGMSQETLLERRAMLSGALAASTDISVSCTSSGPEAIESQTDEILVSPLILQGAVEAERDGFDAFIAYCFSDPGVEACREIVSIPVVGPGASSMALASSFGNRIGVITTRPDNIARTRSRLEKSVYGRLLVSVRSAGIDVTALREDKSYTKKAILDTCGFLVKQDCVDVIILGCLGMASYGNEAAAHLDIPVLDPAYIAVATAEMMVKTGVRHGRSHLPAVKKSFWQLLGIPG